MKIPKKNVQVEASWLNLNHGIKYVTGSFNLLGLEEWDERLRSAGKQMCGKNVAGGGNVCNLFFIFLK